MRIVFVRHGESEANVGDFINDDPRRPVNLTARGRLQALEAAERLRDWHFTQAYASQFPRAQQTATILLQQRDCALVIDARLNERKSGMDGLPTHMFNELVARDLLHACPPRGESFVEQTERLRAFLAACCQLPQEACILAVSHEHPLRSVLALAGIDPRTAVHWKIPNCGMVILERHAGRWHCLQAPSNDS